jgi:serine/threonine protein kinase
MAYVEVWKNEKLLIRRLVDEQKAQKGCRVRLGALGEVHLAIGQIQKLGAFEVRAFAGDPPATERVSEEVTAELPLEGQIPTQGFSADNAGVPVENQDMYPHIEGYEIVGRLGHGGMGTVWRAVQLSTNRPVALKVMAAPGFATDKKARARFEREVELTARLDHPNIARIYDSGLLHGGYYYAMELVDGIPLDQYVRSKELSQNHILVLMHKVCQTVLYAHLHAMIHRDLKPSNILVSEDGEPHILDFGLAKALLEDEDKAVTVSVEGQITGTPAYMSPEQAAGRHDEIDTRTDVFSLGVILYELLLGQSPHDLSGSMMNLLRQITEGKIKRPREIDKSIDPELEAILLKALALEPDDRYISAGALAKDINNYLNDELLDARVPTTLYFLRKKAFKHKKMVGISATSFLVIFVIVIFVYTKIVSSRAVLRATQEEKDALKTEVGNLRAKILSGNQEEIEAALTAFEQRYQTSETKVQEFQQLLEKANIPTTNTPSEIGFYFDKAVNLGEIINSPKEDGTPSISNDGLEMYFYSNRAGCIGDVNQDIWVAKRETKQDPWGSPSNLGAKINSPGVDMNPQLSPDGLSLYFVSNRPRGYGQTDIYEIRRATTKSPWSEPNNLGPVVNSSAWDTDPAISADNLVLYFTSSRSGGYGGTDIWRATRKTTKDPWEAPIAMAPAINSPSTDENPYVSSDGLVFIFSSDRPGGFGRSDIYLSRRQTTYQAWSQPLNLGPVVNSRTNDFVSFISPSDSAIFFSSARTGGYGGLDIWQVPISTTDTGFTCEPAKGNLAAYYPLDDDTKDASGNGWHGIGQAEPLVYETGKIGKALSLPGTSSNNTKQFILTSANSLTLGIGAAHPRTICAWVYTNEFNNGGIFHIGGSQTLEEFCLRVGGKTNLWRAQLWTDDVDFTYPSLKVWVHFAVVYDGSQVIVYADGKPIVNEPRALNTNLDKTPFQIGFFQPGNLNTGTYFNGFIDDVQVYNYALTQAEVKVAMAGVARGTPLATLSRDGKITGRGLVAYYPLDDNANDYTGHGFNGEIQNGPVPFVAGKIGRAVSLNYGTDKAVITEATATDLGINGNNPKTVCTWVYTKEFNNGGIFEISGNSNGRGQVGLRTNNTPNSWRVQIQPTVINFDYPSKNVWVHFALVYDGSQLIVYANGESVVNLKMTLNAQGNRTFQIGRFIQQNVYFNGLIDEVRVYDYSLTQAEIKTVMAGNLP